MYQGLNQNVLGVMQRYWKEARRLRPVEVVAEYEKTYSTNWT